MPENKFFHWLKKLQFLFWIALITLVAFELRITGVESSPPSPYWEEVALGYDAYSILKTGKDHHGNPWPLVAFPSFGDYKPSLYFYAVVPSIHFFGLNTFAVRLPAVLASSLTVGLTSWLAWRWTRSRAIAGWTGILLAIQPWSWVIGRAGFETNLAVCLIVLALVCFEVSQRARPWLQALGFASGAIMLALSAYAYHAGRVWGPAVGFLIFATFTSWKSLPKNPRAWLLAQAKTWGLAAIVAAVLLFPILRELGSPTVQQRVNQTSIFSNSLPLEESLATKTAVGNVWWSRVVFHRWWGRFFDMSGSYWSHFSPSFLFGEGEINPRHTSQFFGMLAPWEIVTVLAGVLAILTAWKGSTRSKRILLGLILLSPAAAMFTLTTPHALRALLLSPWLAIVSAIGLVWGVSLLQQWIQTLIPRLSVVWLARGLWLLVAGGVLISTTIFWLYLRFLYPVHAEEEWQYGYQEVIASLRQNQKAGERLYMSPNFGRPAMYVFFFEQIDPARVQAASPTAAKAQLELLEFEEWTFDEGSNDRRGLHAIPGYRPFPDSLTLLDTISGPSGEVYWNVGRRE